MRITFKLILLAFAVTAAASLLHADSLKEIAAALDMDASYFTAQGYIKYKYDKYGDLEYDSNDKPVIAKQNSDSYWTVQSKTTNDTSPYYGKSCIRSTLGSRTPSASTDGTCARLYLKFFGPGTFSFAYKTATDSDTLNVYIDGEESMEATALCGYGVDQEWDTIDVAIPGGTAPDGTYNHVVIVEFLKSGPSYWDGKYDKVEGPEKPNKDDFDMHDPFDKETYEDLLAEYNSFYNCIWLDRFQWTPDTPTLTFQSGIDFSQTTILDHYDVSFVTTALDFGYFITYTTDGSMPTAQSQRYFTYDSEGDLVENTITVDTTMTVRAKVFTSTGAAYTPTLAISATITVKASDPEITANKQPDGSLKVTMQTLYLTPKVTIDINGNPCIDEESGELVDKNQIYYTLDGSDPKTKGKLYDPVLGVIITDACVIKGVARRDGVLDSEIVEYEVGQTAP
ncbi:MAG: chitobiase/beta-hexosaminidase C-terminal domain-containing protein, partial [Victivallales bacterium]|nr:chitobiase/beta-hexosaminidase C-terminal domain-containing protein [Victivallales bacterium]